MINPENITLNNDPDRNKKCPHCSANFYCSKAVDVHIAHTHSDILIPTDSDVSGINTGHTEPKEITMCEPTETDMNSINVEPAVKGINQESAVNVNGSNTKKNDVMGINSSPDKFDMAVPTVDKTVPDPLSDIITLNNDTNETDKPNSAMGQINISTRNGNHTHSPKPAVPLTNTNKENLNSGHHKRRPKPKGKHHRPTPTPPPLGDQSTAARSKLPKSEFITVTHGIRKQRQICH